MWNRSRRALAALTFAAVGATSALAAQSNGAFDHVYCHNVPGFFDLPPPQILLTYTATGKIRLGWLDHVEVVDNGTLARKLDEAADTDPLPIVEIQSERPEAQFSAILSLVLQAHHHKLTSVWIDTLYPAHAGLSSAGLPQFSKTIFCTLGNGPTSSDIITLAVSADGNIAWNAAPIRSGELQEKLGHATKNGRVPTFQIIADQRAPIRCVNEVLLVLKRNRIEWFLLSSR
jgi:biopolymer transport protein ExbD